MKVIVLESASRRPQTQSITPPYSYTQNGLAPTDFAWTGCKFPGFSSGINQTLTLLGGRTLAVLTLPPEAIRPVSNDEIAYVRQVA